ncbi:MAG TPA: sigma-70 family RNA polymerase sigma factor [Gemmata sp.]|nr:sigma-70 family RNA polymerase sigma factor [Gemmata sp.]
MAIASSILRILSTDLESDSSLLARYIGMRDETAFTALYHRHGPMVRTVCHRYCRDSHLAADAEQGVWLVLAQKAAVVSRPDRLANWLFGVAIRVARKAAVAANRNAVPSVPIGSAPDTSVSVMAIELLRVLDEELAALPEDDRLPLVLCYLEGQTQDEAARACGTCVRTLRRRLNRGREALRRRLERRGIAPAAGFAAIAVVSDAVGAVASLPQVALGCGSVPSSLPPWLSEELAMRSTTWWAQAIAVASLGLVTAAAVAAVLIEDVRPIPTTIAKTAAPVVETPPADLPKGAIARLGSAAFRHPGEVQGLAFTADNRRLSAIGPSAVSRWTVPDGRIVVSAGDREKGYRHLSVIAPDGKLAVELFNREKDAPDGVLYAARVTDLATGRSLGEFQATYGENQPGPYSLHGAISPDGSILAIQYCAEVSLYSLPDGKLLRRLADESRIFRHLVFTPNGKQLIVGSLDKLSLTVWDVKTGANLKTLNADGVGTGGLSISPDGKTVVAVGNRQEREKLPEGGTRSTDHAEAEFVVWDLESTKLLRRIAADAPVKSIHCLTDGTAIGVVEPAETLGKSALRKWRLSDGKLLWSAAADQWIHVAATSHDGALLATVAGDGIVRLWDAATGKVRPLAEGHTRMIDSVAFSADGKSVRTTDSLETRTWDAATGRSKERLASPEFFGEQWDSAGRILAGITKMNDSRLAITVLDTVTGKKLLTVTDPGQKKEFSDSGFALSADGTHLALPVMKDKLLHMQFWDVSTAKLVWDVAMPADWTPRKVVITTDGQVLAGYTDLIALDAGTGKQLARWDLVKSDVLPVDESNNTHLYPSRDGRTLAFVIQNVGIFLVDSRTGKLARRIDTNDEVHWPLSFSADGSRFATSNAFGDTGIRIWETATGKLLGRLDGSPSRVLAIAFSPDGRRLASGSIDGTALVWDVTGIK